eukprot:Pgem_evm1s16147
MFNIILFAFVFCYCYSFANVSALVTPGKIQGFNEAAEDIHKKLLAGTNPNSILSLDFDSFSLDFDSLINDIGGSGINLGGAAEIKNNECNFADFFQ